MQPIHNDLHVFVQTGDPGGSDAPFDVLGIIIIIVIVLCCCGCCCAASDDDHDSGRSSRRTQSAIVITEVTALVIE